MLPLQTRPLVRFGAGELLAGIAAAQLAGEDFLAGLDRQRADAAGQLLAPVPGLSSTTAAGVARRITAGQWKAVEAGLAAVTARMLDLPPAPRAAALAEGPVTIDLDTTDVEVYGRKKRGVAYNRQGQRVGRPDVAAWAETEIVLAADLGAGTDDPRAGAPDLLRRALGALPERARAGGRVAARIDAGYFAGQVARAAHDEHLFFAIGARPIAPLWRLLDGIAEADWHEAIEMEHAQVAVADYRRRRWERECSLRTPHGVRSGSSSSKSVIWSSAGAWRRELSEFHGVGVGAAISVAPAATSRSVVAAVSATWKATRSVGATLRPTSTWSISSAWARLDSSRVARPAHRTTTRAP